MPNDYYSTLGVSKSASADEIKRAYKKLAVKHHPDVNKDPKSEEKFKEINEAYQVLSDPAKKSRYDQFGNADAGAGFGGGGGQGFGGFDFSGFQQQGQGFGGFEDLFDVFFGGQGGSRSADSGRGSDIEIGMTLAFEDAVFGTEKKIEYQVVDTCATCHGKGGENIKTCTTCKGSGHVTKMTRTMLGSFAQTAVCSTCHGTGHIPEKPCQTCRGTGAVKQKKTVTIDVPAGVDDGSSIRVPGKGEKGRTSHGDLYVRLRVTPSREFKREGQTILTDIQIPYAVAVLGGSISVKTIYDTVKLTIPTGTVSHTQFLLRGKGVAHPTRKTKGDHVVTVVISVPKKVSKHGREALEKLEGLLGE